MRRNIDQKVLMTTWPPPNWRAPSKTWNPERFSAWVRYTMASLEVRNFQLMKLGMRETAIQSLRKGIHKPKNTTIHKFCDFVHQLSGADISLLLEEAYEAMKPEPKQ